MESYHKYFYLKSSNRLKAISGTLKMIINRNNLDLIVGWHLQTPISGWAGQGLSDPTTYLMWGSRKFCQGGVLAFSHQHFSQRAEWTSLKVSNGFFRGVRTRIFKETYSFRFRLSVNIFFHPRLNFCFMTTTIYFADVLHYITQCNC